MAALAAACSSSGSSGGGGSGSNGVPAIRVASGGTPDPNGVLHYGVDFPSEFTPNSFDPAKSLNSCDKIDEGLIYDTLTELSPTGQLEPGLALSWSFTGTSLTIHLRPGVKFSDGTPVDANAVKESVLHLKTSPLRTSLEVIKSITVVDPLTLQFQLTKPTAADLLYAWNDLDGMVIAPSAINTASAHPGRLRTVCSRQRQQQRDRPQEESQLLERLRLPAGGDRFHPGRHGSPVDRRPEGGIDRYGRLPTRVPACRRG